MSAAGFYLTGTDTDAGKTHATVALLQALRREGRHAAGMKPVASGCEHGVQGWRNGDALRLQAASDPVPLYAAVNPYALPEATAPQIAAVRAGIAIEMAPLLAAYRQLQADHDCVLVEGVGGWLAPLAQGLEQADLVRTFELPVILVVGLRLGCLNHARLSARAIVADGCRLYGWIANAVDPTLAFADEYFRSLEEALAMPCLGRLPHASAEPTAESWSGSLRPGWWRTGL